MSTIEVRSSSVHIVDLTIDRMEVADYLRDVPPEEREAALIRALEIGVLALWRAASARETEFVRQQVELLLTQLESASAAIPAKVEEALLGKLGMEQGQALAPVRQLMETVSRSMTERVNEVKSLLSQELAPDRESSTLGKALKTIRDLLDPSRTDSLQGRLDEALRRATSENGTLAASVKVVVADAVKPLAEKVEGLVTQLTKSEAERQALQQTTYKGAAYEEEVVSRLRDWAQGIGAQVEHVGVDNQPGDIVITFPEMSLGQPGLTIVVEAKDEQTRRGKKVISDVIEKAMQQRQANAGVYLSRTREGLANEVGDWQEGMVSSGPWVATTDPHLVTAVRFLNVFHNLRRLRETRPEVDASSISAQLGRIRTALTRLKNIHTKAGQIQGAVESIKDEIEALREEVSDALNNAERSLKVSAVKVA